MEIKIFTFVLVSFLLFTYVKAKIYNFNVVSLSGIGYTLGVKYNNQIANLSSTYFPLFTGTVNADNIDKYKYVVMDGTGAVVEEEKFERVYSDKNDKLNEVYNRTNKNIEIPKLPEPLSVDYKMGSKNFQPFPKNVIYNIYANCNEADYNDRKNNPFIGETRNNLPVNCTINIISPEHVYQGTGSIHIVGYGSRLYKKLSWILKLDKKFMGRKSVKIRAVADDLTLMHDKISADLYRAMGVPVQEGTYARFMVNNDVWGLFTIVDSISKKWFASYIHGDDKAHVGTSYKLMSSHPDGPFADLQYIDDNYNSYVNGGVYQPEEVDTLDPEANITVPGSEWHRFIRFVKQYSDWANQNETVESSESLKSLEQFLDVETTLRMMAIDTLTLALDNFWFVQSNTILYYNPEKNKYQFIPYDFDDSLKGQSEYFDFEEIKSDCLNWANVNTTGANLYFTDNLLKNKKIKERYDIVLAAASRNLFTIDVLSPYIDAITNLIEEDIEWNYELAKNYNTLYDGRNNIITFDQFKDASNYGHVSYQEGTISTDVSYGLKEYIQIRGDNCRAYTKDVVVPSSAYSIAIKSSLIIVLSHFLFYLLF